MLLKLGEVIDSYYMHSLGGIIESANVVLGLRWIAECVDEFLEKSTDDNVLLNLNDFVILVDSRGDCAEGLSNPLFRKGLPLVIRHRRLFQLRNHSKPEKVT